MLDELRIDGFNAACLFTETRRRLIEDEPDLSPNPVLNALLGAAGEHPARPWDLGEAPAWTSRPERYLDRPYDPAQSLGLEGR